jgi:hypothetical protein
MKTITIEGEVVGNIGSWDRNGKRLVVGFSKLARR